MPARRRSCSWGKGQASAALTAFAGRRRHNHPDCCSRLGFPYRDPKRKEKLLRETDDE
jgi:hypothetical protein